MIEGLIGLGVVLLGVLVMRLRARADRRRRAQSAGQVSSSLLPNGEFAVWQVRPMRLRTTGRVSVDGGVLARTPRGALQPDRQVPLSQVGFRVLRPTRWVDLVRVRLRLPGERPVTVRVSREGRRPVGPLDPGYELRLQGYTADFVDRMRRAGAVEGEV